MCGKYSIKHSSVKGKVEIFNELSVLCATVTVCTASCGFQIHFIFLTDYIYTFHVIACDQLAFVMEFWFVFCEAVTQYFIREGDFTLLSFRSSTRYRSESLTRHAGVSTIIV